MILEPPLSIGAGGRSPEKTSPGMVDRPAKRQGPGPGCGEVEDGVLAWHGGFDRPSVRTRPGDDRAGRSLRPSAGEKVTRSLGSTPTPCSSSLSSETLGAKVPARLKVFVPAGARYPRSQGSALSWKHDTDGDAPGSKKEDRPGEGAPGRSAGRRAARRVRRGARDGGTSALSSLAKRRDLRGSMTRTKREHTFSEIETGCVERRAQGLSERTG